MKDGMAADFPRPLGESEQTELAMKDGADIPTGVWITREPAETHALGEQVGRAVRGGEVFLLDGPLGAGKTIFIKGLTSALGIEEDDVSSPSFTLVNRYTGRLTFYHLDLYRMPEGSVATFAVDLEELLSDAQAVIAIEWAERIGRFPLPETTWHVRIEGDGEAPRRITIEKLGSDQAKG
jgi:tRNA threonylcarbamoyladenosine biosynthesis protein TsaE